MAEAEAEDNLLQGILEIQGANAVWLDPVAVLNRAYSQYQVSHSRYYSRPSFGNLHSSSSSAGAAGSQGNTRKRKRKKTYTLNEKEVLAEIRHKVSRTAISHAHSLFLATRPPLSSLKVTVDNLSRNCPSSQQLSTLADANTNASEEAEMDFVRLAELWQAPLYELNYLRKSSQAAESDVRWCQESRAAPLFGSFVEHDEEEALAECAGCTFILPRNCRFLISDVSHIHQLIPEHPDFGYNLILIDPPWENKSVHRKSLYPTLPNRQLLSLPIKQLVHSEGALLALWLTNREKLHQFVEKELFPAWGVELAASWYWLKLNDSGQMISPLDLQHHKPYECLLLGYLPGNKQEAYSDETAQEGLMSMRGNVCNKSPPNKFVIMSIPGDHSRKPPLGCILLAL